MDPMLLSDAFKIEALSLPALSGLAIHAGLASAILTPPTVVFHTVCDKLLGQGKNGYFSVSAIIKSMTAESEAHGARVELVRAAFVDNKAARITSINGRGAIQLSPYGALPAKNEVIDGHAITTLVFKVAASMV